MPLNSMGAMCSRASPTVAPMGRSYTTLVLQVIYAQSKN